MFPNQSPFGKRTTKEASKSGAGLYGMPPIPSSHPAEPPTKVTNRSQSFISSPSSPTFFVPPPINFASKANNPFGGAPTLFTVPDQKGEKSNIFSGDPVKKTSEVFIPPSGGGLKSTSVFGSADPPPTKLFQTSTKAESVFGGDGGKLVFSKPQQSSTKIDSSIFGRKEEGETPKFSQPPPPITRKVNSRDPRKAALPTNIFSSSQNTLEGSGSAISNPFKLPTEGPNMKEPLKMKRDDEKRVFSSSSANIFTSKQSSSAEPPDSNLFARPLKRPEGGVSSRLGKIGSDNPFATGGDKNIFATQQQSSAAPPTSNHFERTLKRPEGGGIMSRLGKKPTTTDADNPFGPEKGDNKNIFATQQSAAPPASNLFARNLKRPEMMSRLGKKSDQQSAGGPMGEEVAFKKPVIKKTEGGGGVTMRTFKKPPAAQNQPHHEPNVAPQGPIVNETELLAVMKRQAFNDQDKFDILEARDKLMKAKGLHKQSVKLKGTCPDMCPEKERYSRVSKNQLRIYEKIGEDINHKATVKEYSRSSADQGVPLPHDLRPSSVLNMTMNHLLANVIDRVENMGTTMKQWYDSVINPNDQQIYASGKNTNENLGEWFEYIWSATRAIRKDITQQQLSDLVAVGLVEKCARFHIMCSARLIEEDSSNFSPKLNDENLTKCLQTLKHMYEDLKHENVQCKNEPEFRTYEVLMNLNDGDTLRSILTLDEWVREDPNIKLGLKICMALSSNNYIKFFKFVRKTTLLQGCVLMRYFFQVRERALSTIVRSYCPSQKHVIQYSLTKLTFLLGFEDIQSCGLYCRLHGLDYEVNADIVYLTRDFYSPDELPEFLRAKNLIETKRHIPWSEVLNGGEPVTNPYLTYVPQNSFDEQGFLKQDSMRILTKPPVQSPEEKKRLEVQQARQIAISESSTEIMVQVIAETLATEVSKVAEAAKKECEQEKLVAEEAEVLVSQVLEEQTREVCQTAIREAQNQELQNRLRHETKMEAAKDLGEDIVRECVDNLILNLAEEEMRLVEKEKRLLNLYKLGEGIVEELCDELTAALSDQIAKEAVVEAEKERLLQIKRFAERVRIAKLRKMFESWKMCVLRKRKTRSMLSQFPSTPGNFSVQEQNDLLFMKFSKQIKLDNSFGALDLQEDLSIEMLKKPFDLVKILSQNCKSNSHKIEWKGLLCFPTVNEDSSLQLLVEAVKQKFRLDDERGGNVLCSHRFFYGEREIAVCVKFLDDTFLEEQIAQSEKKRRQFLLGTRGILFIHIEEVETLDEMRYRLQRLIDHCFEHPPIPIQILTTSNDIRHITEVTGCPNVSHIPPNIFDATFVPKLAHAFLSVLRNEEPMKLSLKLTSLRNLVDDFICRNVLSHFYSNLADRKEKRLPHQDPNKLLDLFNSSVDHLKKVSRNSKLAQISWPIPEFSKKEDELPNYWNDESYLDVLCQSLSSLHLPPMTIGEDVEQSVFQYLDQVSNRSGDESECRVRIKKFLDKAGRRRRSSSWSDLRSSIPWTDVVHALIDFKISVMNTIDPYSTLNVEMKVAVLKEDFDMTFKPPKSWSQTLNESPKNSIERSKVESKPRLNRKLSNINFEEELNASLRFEEKLSRSMNSSLVDLEHSKVEKEENSNLTVSDFKDERVARTRYLPAVSLLSPTLGELSTQKSICLRYREARRVSNEKKPSKRKTFEEEYEDYGGESEMNSNRSQGSSRSNKMFKEISDLQQKIDTDLNDSRDFEKRLFQMIQ